MKGQRTLLIFGALPPARSGTADYLEEQMQDFASRWNVVVVVGDEAKVRSRSDCMVLNYSSFKKRRGEFQDAARLIHLANNPFHAHAYLEAKNPGAVLLLHEFSMHHLLTETTLAYGDNQGYLNELVACGPEGELVSGLRAQGLWSGIEQFLFPAIESRLRIASGVIGHSKWILDRVDSVAPDTPTVHIPHHFSSSNNLDRHSCRKLLGMKDGELAVVSLGFVTPAKCIEQVVSALAGIRSEVPPFKFWIFGEMRHPTSVRQAIKKHDMTDVVIEKGYTPLSTFEAAIEASDLVVNLRYPTVGETSGTMTRAMGSGKPVVVFRYGSFAEPPPSAVIGVPLDTFSSLGLSDACKKAMVSSTFREAVGLKAKHWASAVTPSESVHRQSRFISRCLLPSRGAG